MLTSGTLSGLQEVLASWIAQDRNKNGHYFTSRVPKMAVYGAFISAPMGHLLIKILQGLFKNRTSLKAKILQILVSNLIVSDKGPFVRLAYPLNPDHSTGLPNPEHRVSGIHGTDCWRTHLPSSSRYRQSRFHACHESHLDLLSASSSLRPAVPPARSMGSLLQHRRLRHRHLYQRSHQEEETCCPEEEEIRRGQRLQHADGLQGTRHEERCPKRRQNRH